MTDEEVLEKMADRFVGVRAASVHPDEVLHVKWSDLVELFTDEPRPLTPDDFADHSKQAGKMHDPYGDYHA